MPQSRKRESERAIPDQECREDPRGGLPRQLVPVRPRTWEHVIPPGHVAGHAPEGGGASVRA
eukprot:68174-Alexandrium_andersonii.AAC.1